MKAPLLHVQNLKKAFPIYSGLLRHQVGEIKAVNGIDFIIQHGKILAMVGESGSGKSTAARAAIRLIEPTQGRIRFCNEDLMAFNKMRLKSIRRYIQMIFQNPYTSLNPRKTVLQCIGEALLYHGLAKNVQEQTEQVATVLRKIGLSPDAMHLYPHQFSGGQQQRICIGRAIALKPKLLICDEPVSSLDVSIQAQILNLLQELKESMQLSYLFISHDLSVVRHIADDIVVMLAGKIVERGSNNEIFENPKNDYTKRLLEAIPCVHPAKKTVSGEDN